MITISYTLTPTIQDALMAIDQFRRGILTIPLSPHQELKLRWMAMYESIYGSLNLAGFSITKAELTSCLAHPPKRPTGRIRDALAYKSALLHIRDTWSASTKPLSLAHIETLGSIALPEHTRQFIRSIREEEVALKRFLAYIVSQKDHPVLLAAVSYAQLSGIEAGTISQGLIPRLIASLMLTKYGYDCRGMVSVEGQWIEASENHKKALESIAKYGQLTAWLEHFTKSARNAYEALYQFVQQASVGVPTELAASTWSLNEREQHILELLENPTAKITNRDAQHLFHISQVTASRDLSHLAALGLLYAHGKGRSVYYTKI